MVTSSPAADTVTASESEIVGKIAAIMKPSVPTAKVPSASAHSAPLCDGGSLRGMMAASTPRMASPALDSFRSDTAILLVGSQGDFADRDTGQ
jgi:hypothetical protein